MRKSPENHPRHCTLPIFVSFAAGLAGLSATLRGQPGPALRRQKSETCPKRRLNEKLSPYNDQSILYNHRLF